ncbi:integrase [Methylosinus sp. R-45379]|uniref:tyrosine-type recombinase/integrase n=1 Tax=Methylosinus sp. R-45379 TaxID=980563 RepID=UPI0007C95226|nr:site-specific integrase [Methylosinus sp. R-45379]OAI28683.1 integrase [Methylosinus sp. R-45379]
MAKTVRDSKLDSRAARERLKPQPKPYFRALDIGLHLGYRKGKTGGKWVVRRYIGDEKYLVETIGTADDGQDADGAEVLTFSQAQAKARERAADSRETRPAAPFTVDRALDEYLSRLESEHSKSLGDARNRAANLIRPKLGAVLVADLDRDKLTAWRNEIANRPRHVRGKKGKAARALPAPQSDEEKRRRQASANRTLTVLRAALNQAFREGKIDSDVAWRAVKPFREVETARVRYFTVDEARRIVNASQGAFRTLVNAALFTGCRYGELTRLRVADFNPDAGTLSVGKSKSGKARHVVLTEEGQVFFRQVTAGRESGDLLLEKDGGGAWGASHQLRPMKEACAGARIKPAGFHILRHTYASLLAMAGAPLNVIAKNLGHADTRMCEKHYAHLAPSYLAETIRKFAPTLGTHSAGNFTSFGTARERA